MHGNGMDNSARQAGLMSGMMQVRGGGQGNGTRMDFAGLAQAGGGMGGFTGGGMLHGMPQGSGSLGGSAHSHVGMGGGLINSNGMRGGGMAGIKGGMVGGLGPGSNGFLLPPFDALSQEPLSAGLAHDAAVDVSPADFLIFVSCRVKIVSGTPSTLSSLIAGLRLCRVLRCQAECADCLSTLQDLLKLGLVA